MTQQSEVRIEHLQLWDFDLGVLSDGLSHEGKVIRRLARRLVARRALSNAGEYPGKSSGRLQQTIAYKKFSSGLGVYITHKMGSDEYRYPFALVHGSPDTNVESRGDYIGDTFESRKVFVVAMLRKALKDAAKAKDITL